MFSALLTAALVSAAVAALTTWWLARNASSLGLMDVPNRRSSHRHPLPRGGGIGIAAGAAAGFVVLAAMGMFLSKPLATALGGVAAIATLGLLDDIRSIPARYRLVVQAIVAVAVVQLLGGISKLPLPPPIDVSLGWLAAPLAILWLMTLANFYNFMDGLDGLAGGQAVASCVGAAIAGWSLGATQLAIILAGASCGFLVLNSPPARIFLGDVGSTALGFAIGCLPLLAPQAERPRAMLAVMIGLILFLADPAETLLRRIRGGHKIGVAHRSHSYQRLADAAGRHRAVTIFLILCGFMLAVGAGLSYRAHGPSWQLLAFGVSAFVAERFLAGRVTHVVT